MTGASPPALPAGLRRGGRFAEWRPARPAYVVADVDGTLIGRSGVPTDEVVAAARRAREHGVAAGFATGRMRLGVAELWERLRLPGPHVLHNGAEVRADGTTIASWPLSQDGIAAIFRIAADRDRYAELYLEDGFAVTRWDERARAHWDILGMEPFGRVRGPGDLDGDVLKATFAAFDHEGVDELIAELRAAGREPGPAGSPMTPDITYVNATDPAADKGRAVAAAARHLGLSLAEVVAVGDSTNDLSMLAAVGTAIAMGQSEPEIVAVAHLVAPSVDEDGVAVAFDQVVAWRDHGV